MSPLDYNTYLCVSIRLQHIPECFVPSQGHWENSAPVIIRQVASTPTHLHLMRRVAFTPAHSISCVEWHPRQLMPISTLSDTHVSSSPFIHFHFYVSSGICASSCPRSPTTSHHEAQKCQKCDRGCQCLIQAQLIWVIRPNSHCRNQRWSRTFPVGNSLQLLSHQSFAKLRP